MCFHEITVKLHGRFSRQHNTNTHVEVQEDEKLWRKAAQNPTEYTNTKPQANKIKLQVISIGLLKLHNPSVLRC